MKPFKGKSGLTKAFKTTFKTAMRQGIPTWVENGSPRVAERIVQEKTNGITDGPYGTWRA